MSDVITFNEGEMKQGAQLCVKLEILLSARLQVFLFQQRAEHLPAERTLVCQPE